jgi:DNA-binding ferritin-like protein
MVTWNNKKVLKLKTRKISLGKSNKSEEKIVLKFLQILLAIKIYHWKTMSYSTHKATDELYSKLNDNIDHFVEVMLGKNKNNKRINLSKVKTLPLMDFTSNEQLKREMDNFIIYLNKLNLLIKEELNTDLFNIRDEILADINQFLYLLTLSQ